MRLYAGLSTSWASHLIFKIEFVLCNVILRYMRSQRKTKGYRVFLLQLTITEWFFHCLKSDEIFAIVLGIFFAASYQHAGREWKGCIH